MSGFSKRLFAAAVAVILVVALSSGGAFAGKITVSTTATVISDGSGSSRVLIRPGDLSAVRGHLVTSARLGFTLPGQAAGRDIPVRAYPLTTDWTAGSVTWSSPWTVGGVPSLVEKAWRSSSLIEV